MLIQFKADDLNRGCEVKSWWTRAYCSFSEVNGELNVLWGSSVQYLTGLDFEFVKHLTEIISVYPSVHC